MGLLILSHQINKCSFSKCGDFSMHKPVMNGAVPCKHSKCETRTEKISRAR